MSSVNLAKKLAKDISIYENENITDKPWELLGEVDESLRPKDSLLDVYLPFDYGSVKAPEITLGVSKKMEKLIKQRIKDKTWDDVERKLQPTVKGIIYNPVQKISSEKSKEGLADVYEKQYLSAFTKSDETSERPEVIEIKKDLDKVLSLLDALCNYNFAPKPNVAEFKIKSVEPAMSKNDVIPMHASEYINLAPEEIAPKIDVLPTASKELTKTQKSHNRRQKKIFQRKKFRQQISFNSETKTPVKKSSFGTKRYFDVDLAKFGRKSIKPMGVKKHKIKM